MEIKTLAILFLCLSCSGILSIMYYAARSLRTDGSRPFFWFMASTFVYSLGYMLELSGSTYPEIFFALKIQYLGIPFIAVFWFLFAFEYNKFKIRDKRLFGLLFLIPCITVVMLYTNEWHHLYYSDLAVDTTGPFPVADAAKGLWYRIEFAYENVLSLAGIALFFAMTTRTRGYRRKQANTLFFASLIPWTGHIFNVVVWSPYGIDMTPFYLATAVPLFAFAMSRLRLFDIAPVARTRVFATMGNPVIVLDKDLLIADFNQAAGALLPELGRAVIGLGAREVLGTHEDFMDKVSSAEDAPVEIELEASEGVRHFSMSVTRLFSSKDKYLGLIVLLHDVTESRLLVRKLHRMAAVDALTQVHSRGFFMESCLRELRRVAQARGNLSFLLIDVDHFKKVNDTHGHAAGDLVLQGVTRGFRSVLRGRDIIGRYGGEEFAILLPDTDLPGATSLADRLRAVVEEMPITHDGTDIRVTVSVGVASVCFAENAMEIDFDKLLAALLKDADQALYSAKESGRNRVCTAGPTGVST